ncbi:nitrile hydratase accessory protein [Haloferax sp. MBLA0076]|uniref:Nitrile hydratase accessory protein n=1 Tax=Haloferax litoreum TaxID=2666140 RepID=A0A6A8GNE8_9EURY|nr:MULTISPECIES: nitrile hydratase accessory protein [Haloferax]KAB1190445.1 nitrile hydratase accessory protein [Haloferax sp. CBA1148]MRX23420.1 nitrile hydratase accessory protein [Haloferax litoreum]
MSETSKRIEDLVSSGAIPRRGDEPVFEEPWQARAFGLVLSLCDDGVISWDAFQRQLVEEIGTAPSDSNGEGPNHVYYEHWLRAFEKLLVDTDVLSGVELRGRAGEFASGDRDASEFTLDEAGNEQ